MVLPSSYVATIKDAESEVLLSDISSVKSSLQVSAEELPGEIGVVKPSSTAPLVQDHTYFKKISTATNSKQNKQPKPTPTLSVGSKVNILKNQKPVGTGLVAEGNILHGHDVPDGYVKLIIQEIELNVKPVVKSAFDDDEETLSAGQFVMWPLKNVKVIP